MIAVACKFSVEVQGRPDRYCDVLYVIEKPSTVLVYCASDPDTQEQLFIDANTVSKIVPH